MQVEEMMKERDAATIAARRLEAQTSLDLQHASRNQVRVLVCVCVCVCVCACVCVCVWFTRILSTAIPVCGWVGVWVGDCGCVWVGAHAWRNKARYDS